MTEIEFNRLYFAIHRIIDFLQKDVTTYSPEMASQILALKQVIKTSLQDNDVSLLSPLELGFDEGTHYALKDRSFDFHVIRKGNIYYELRSSFLSVFTQNKEYLISEAYKKPHAIVYFLNKNGHQKCVHYSELESFDEEPFTPFFSFIYSFLQTILEWDTYILALKKEESSDLNTLHFSSFLADFE